jgi:hypothetical protein
LATPGTLRAGERVRFKATASASPGVHIYEYRWDFNGDGHFDADTGNIATASHHYTAGSHTVTLETIGVTDADQTVTSTTHVNFQMLAATAGCSGQLTLGFLDFLSSCIKDSHGKYSINLDGGVGFAGLELSSNTAGAKLTLDTTGADDDGHHNPNHQWLLSADGPVTLSIVNTAIGTIQLDTIDLHNSPIVIPIGANAPDQNAPGLRIFTFEAQSSCPSDAHALPPVVCAQVPGGFPLTGNVSVYVTAGAGDQPGAAVTANMAIQRPINITGNLTLSGDASGVNVDQFGFSSPSFNIGSLVTVDPVTVMYQRRDPHGSDMNVWTAGGGAHLHVSSNLGVTINLRFANGRFQSFSFNLTGSVPLGPVVLQQLGGTLGFDPFELGGNLGGIIGPLGITAGVLYTGEYDGQPWHLQIGSADPDHDPHHVAALSVKYPSVNPLLKASGELDLYGDGFISGAIDVNFGLPNADHPSTVNVGGYVHGWFDPPSAAVPHPQYQVSGGVYADVHAFLHVYGDVQGFVNNYWSGGTNYSYASGCGEVSVDVLGFHPTAGVWIRVDLAHNNRVDDGFGGCSNISSYCAPAAVTGSHTVPSCLGFSSVAAAVRFSSSPQRFWIPAGESLDNIKVTSPSGVPHVQITGPAGTYTTPVSGEATGVKPFVGGIDPAQHAAQITVFDPPAGAYTITPLPGSPPISPPVEAHPLPSPHVAVRITGRGSVRTLHYSMRTSPGQTVTFFERAADVSTKLGTTGKARGEITFHPQVAQFRARTIEADLYENGIPQKPLKVGHYTAPPPPRLGRPGKVHATRRANMVTLTWSAVRGAESYQVFVRGSDGRRQLYVTRRQVRRLRIKPVFPETSLTVTVAAVGGLYHEPGRARALAVKRARAKR